MENRSNLHSLLFEALTDLAAALHDPKSDLPIVFAETLHEVLSTMQSHQIPIGRSDDPRTMH